MTPPGEGSGYSAPHRYKPSTSAPAKKANEAASRSSPRLAAPFTVQDLVCNLREEEEEEMTALDRSSLLGFECRDLSSKGPCGSVTLWGLLCLLCLHGSLALEPKLPDKESVLPEIQWDHGCPRRWPSAHQTEGWFWAGRAPQLVASCRAPWSKQGRLSEHAQSTRRVPRWFQA